MYRTNNKSQLDHITNNRLQYVMTELIKKIKSPT